MIDWKGLVKWGSQVNASDIFWKPGSEPHTRIRGVVQPIPEQEMLTPDDAEAIARDLMDEEEWQQFKRYPEKDIGLTIGETCRLRINVYRERGNVALVMRIIPLDILTIDDLELPEVLKEIALRPQGLVLVTGPTGCGKSTTLAAMLDLINRERQAHIVTIEDPIEYVHRDKKCIVSQRAVGIDTDDFQDALKYTMRQSPDVILIGEMRDVTTMSVAMQAAETGHLVFSTVHTTSAAETMERIVNMFPPHDKPQICLRMSKSLQSVISQSLVPRQDKRGRIAAVEVMVVTPTVSKYIEEGKIGETYEAIEEGEHWGMQTMNQSLLKLYEEDIIDTETAMFYAGNRTEMRQMLRRVDGIERDEAAAAEKKRQQQARRANVRQQQDSGSPSAGGQGG